MLLRTERSRIVTRIALYLHEADLVTEKRR
jgi:hypothetical protein